MILNQEQLEIKKMVRDFAEKEIRPIAAEYDRRGEFPMELYKKVCDMGLNCLDLPVEYGGPGLSRFTACVVREEMSRGDAGFALSAGASTLSMKPLLFAGTEEQRRYVADIVVNGGFAAFALTEPEAGSDAGACRTTAVKVGDEYVLNGHKCFCTNGALANVYTVMATVDKSLGSRGLTMFLVDRDTPGLSVGRHEDKMGIRLSNTTDIVLEDVKIPAKNIIGGEGQGFKIAMKTLDQARAYTAFSAIGIAQAAFEHAIQYSQVRKTFGKRICDNQAIQFMLADMAMKIETARQLGFHAIEQIEADSPWKAKYGAMAKCYATDAIQSVTSDAVQIMGGYGYMHDYPVEKLMRDAKIYQIFEGTNQIQRIVISSQLLKEYKI